MKSIGREVEFERVNARIDSLKSVSGNKVHFAVAAPRNGGLTLFLSDLAEHRRAIGDIVLYSTISDSLAIDEEFANINRKLAAEVGDHASDGSIETLIRLCRRLRDRDPNRIAVLILDIAPALRAISESTELRRSAKSNPLIQKLRTLVNLLQNHEPPIAIVVGWDDRFRGLARDWEVGDAIQRYSVETLFADFGKGRAAWPLFRDIFQAVGLKVSGDFPGICGSVLPAGAFVAEAKRVGQDVVDGTFLLNVLRNRVAEADRESLAHIDEAILESLCLSDRVLKIDPHLGALVQLSEDGGYVASSELYRLLGLAPPREIVSFEESIRLRLDDADPELPNEVAKGLAIALANGEPRSRAGGGINFMLKDECLPPVLHKLEILLLWSFGAIAEPTLVETGSTWIAEGERSPALGMGRLLIMLHYDPALRNAFARGIEKQLTELEIHDPRPHGAKAGGRKTQARFLAGLLTLQLEIRQIVDAAWRTRDPSHTDELVQTISEEIRSHYTALAKYMPRLSVDAFSTEAIQALIHGCGAPVEIGSTAGERLKRLEIATGSEGGHYIWRWRNDALMQWIADNGQIDSGVAVDRFYLDPDDWSRIGSALQSAFGDSLVRWNEGIISAVNPLLLLQGQYLNVRAQFEESLNSYLAIAEAVRRDIWKDRLTELAETPPDNPLKCEDAIDQAWQAFTELKSEREARERFRDELAALKGQLPGVKTTNEQLQEEKRQIEAEIDRALARNQEYERALNNSREFIAKIGEAATRAKHRTERAASVRNEAKELAKVVVQNKPELKPEVDEIISELDDENVPIERVAGTLENLKIKVERTTKQEPKLSPESPVIRETFTNDDNDLVRLAAIYTQKKIVEVDIK